MQTRLFVVGGDANPPEVDVELPISIGRGRDNQLCLPHPLVSRHHCRLIEQDGRIVVEDMGSLNGTYVGKIRVETPTILPTGGLLTVGTVTFRAVYETVESTDETRTADGQGTTDGLFVDANGQTVPMPDPSETPTAWNQSAGGRPSGDHMPQSESEADHAVRQTVRRLGRSAASEDATVPVPRSVSPAPSHGPNAAPIATGPPTTQPCPSIWSWDRRSVNDEFTLGDFDRTFREATEKLVAERRSGKFWSVSEFVVIESVPGDDGRPNRR